MSESTPLISQLTNNTVDEIDADNKSPKCCTSTIFNSNVFFDAKKGWMQYFDPMLNIKQLLVRNREGAFYAFDAFRALAFLWVSNNHLIEGLSIAFSDMNTWAQSKSSYRSFGSVSEQGVTVFFCISGFLNFFVAIRIAESLKVHGMSFRVIRNFLFRRYMHLAPNLYLIVPIAMMIGYYNTNSSSITIFYTDCIDIWWTNFLFMANFDSYIYGKRCFNSTWTISAEMQFYLCSVPILFLYCWNKVVAFTFITLLIAGVVVYRDTFIIYDNDLYYKLVYSSPLGRADAYFLGMLLYILYENIVKPIKTRSYNHGNKVATSSSTCINGSGNNNNNSGDKTTKLNSMDNSSASVNVNEIQSATTADDENVKDDDDIYFQFQAFIKDNIIQPTYTYYSEKSSQLRFLHSHAPLYMIISIYCAWVVATCFIVTGFLYVFTDIDYYFYNWYDSADLTDISQSYGFFVVAGATVSLLFISIEGSTVAFIPWIFNQYFWYPLGNLTYTGYLLSIITTFNVGSVILRYNNNQQVSWVDLNYGLGVYFGIYCGVVLLNLVLALIFSILVERPFMNVAKAIIFNDLW